MTAAGVGASALGATMLTNSIRIWWIGMRVQADPRYTGLLTCDLSQPRWLNLVCPLPDDSIR
jgi:hypothetical protein